MLSEELVSNPPSIWIQRINARPVIHSRSKTPVRFAENVTVDQFGGDDIDKFCSQIRHYVLLRG